MNGRPMKRFSRAILALVVGDRRTSWPVKKSSNLNLVTSQGVGQSIGSVTITETDKGLGVLRPDLKTLPPW